MAKNGAIDQMPQYRANLPRTGHSLSHALGMTATVAHLLPVFHTVLNPGEKISLGFDFNIRTMPLEAASFADLTTHVEYFFVPMQLLYQPFENVLYGIDEQFSSSFDDGAVTGDFPLCDFNAGIAALHTNRALPVTTIYGPDGGPYSVESIGQNAIRMFDLMGFNPTGIAYGENSGFIPNVFPYQFLAYNCIYQYYYRLDNREKFNNNFNWDSYYNGTGQVQPEQNLLLLKYRPLGSDYFTDIKKSPIVDVLNMHAQFTPDTPIDWLSGNSNPQPVAASQNNGVYTTFEQAFGASSVGGQTGNPIYPDGATEQEYTQVTRGGLLIGQTYMTGASANVTSNRNASSSGLVQLKQDHVHDLTGGTGISALNTANIRALFANEKLWSITGRAKKNYDDQTLAHFGFKVPHDVKHQISCFGHDISHIHIGEVISTAGTADVPLGEIAGKGYGAQSGRKHSFVAPCHGVVMAIFSVVPTRNYEGGFAKFNAVTDRNSFYMPEYDHLGMQPVFGYEADYFLDDFEEPRILGWQYRYEEWKRRYNRVTGAFANHGGTLNSWIPSYRPPVVENIAGVPDYKYFMNLPTDINQIMLAQYQNVWSEDYEQTSDSWRLIYDYDPFVVNGYINCSLVSTMSDHSLPRLDC